MTYVVIIIYLNINIMASQFKTFVIGSTGLISTEVTAQAADTISIPISDWTTAITQVIIAMATLFGLFRKRSKK